LGGGGGSGGRPAKASRSLFAALNRLFRIYADHNFVFRQAGRAWVKQDKPVQHFFDDVVRVVNELLHDEANVQR
jgi:hypothetical protein